MFRSVNGMACCCKGTISMFKVSGDLWDQWILCCNSAASCAKYLVSGPEWPHLNAVILCHVRQIMVHPTFVIHAMSQQPISFCPLFQCAGGQTSESRYQCQFCSATFGRKWTCDRHMMIKHLPPEKFFCPVCNQSFTRRDSRNYHIKSKHTDILAQLKDSQGKPTWLEESRAAYCTPRSNDHSLYEAGTGLFSI